MKKLFVVLTLAILASTSFAKEMNGILSQATCSTTIKCANGTASCNATGGESYIAVCGEIRDTYRVCKSNVANAVVGIYSTSSGVCCSKEGAAVNFKLSHLGKREICDNIGQIVQ